MVRQQRKFDGPVSDEPVQESRVLYRDDRTAIGEYRWYSYRAGERRRSPTGPWPLIVVPWTAVRITQDGAEPVIADTSTTVFYNPHQPYIAEQLLDDQPERSIYIVPDAEALAECVREIDPKISDDPKRILRFTHGPCAAREFRDVRWLVSRLMTEKLDALAVQEMLLWITHTVVKSAYECRRANRRSVEQKLREEKSREHKSRTSRRHDDAVVAARELLVNAFEQPLGLPQIAQAAGASTYHLCRIFRDRVGISIHQYRTELRLRASMQHLCETRDSLAAIALRVGFSSQSHFTTAFSRRFHRTPGEFRSAQFRSGEFRSGKFRSGVQRDARQAHF